MGPMRSGRIKFVLQTVDNRGNKKRSGEHRPNPGTRAIVAHAEMCSCLPPGARKAPGGNQHARTGPTSYTSLENLRFREHPTNSGIPDLPTTCSTWPDNCRLLPPIALAARSNNYAFRAQMLHISRESESMCFAFRIQFRSLWRRRDTKRRETKKLAESYGNKNTGKTSVVCGNGRVLCWCPVCSLHIFN